MIVKISNTNGFDHYHICNRCKSESSPDECVDDAEDCVDILCTPCETDEELGE